MHERAKVEQVSSKSEHACAQVDGRCACCTRCTSLSLRFREVQQPSSASPYESSPVPIPIHQSSSAHTVPRITAQHSARPASSLTAATAEARRSRGLRHHEPVAQACGCLSYSWVAGTAWRVRARERRARASDGQRRLGGRATSAVRDRSGLHRRDSCMHPDAL